jgi:hypothetical protein
MISVLDHVSGYWGVASIINLFGDSAVLEWFAIGL